MWLLYEELLCAGGLLGILELIFLVSSQTRYLSTVASADCPSTTWALWLEFRTLLSAKFRAASRLQDRSRSQRVTRKLGTGSREEREQELRKG